MRANRVVVGAGLTGLGCATALAADGPVTLIDRIPVVGGEAGWRSSRVRTLAEDARDQGVRLHLGATGVRWQDRRLLVASPGAITWVPSDVLFFAGGIRPSTAIEMQVVGDRPAGVIPATVALHLLQSDVPLWKDVVVLGTSHWGSEVASMVRAYGGFVTAISADDHAPSWADRAVTRASSLRVIGRTRVEAFSYTVDEREQTTTCDAVVLAGPSHPNRNIDGAVDEQSDGVVFVQPDDRVHGLDRYVYGRQAAQQWIQAQEAHS